MAYPKPLNPKPLFLASALSRMWAAHVGLAVGLEAEGAAMEVGLGSTGAPVDRGVT